MLLMVPFVDIIFFTIPLPLVRLKVLKHCGPPLAIQVNYLHASMFLLGRNSTK